MTSARFLVISETHNQWPYNDSNPVPSDVDVFIHCGDLTQVGGLASIKRAMEQIKSVPAELRLVIAGNHDLELDERWVRDNLDDDDDELLHEHIACRTYVQSLKQSGVHFLDEGMHTFTLASGRKFTVYATPYTPEFNGYAFAYGPDENRFTSGPKPIPTDTKLILFCHTGLLALETSRPILWMRTKKASFADVPSSQPPSHDANHGCTFLGIFMKATA